MSTDIERRLEAAAQATDEAVAAWDDGRVVRFDPNRGRRGRVIHPLLSAAAVAAAVVGVVVVATSGGTSRNGTTGAGDLTAQDAAFQVVRDGLIAQGATDVVATRITTQRNGDYEIQGHYDRASAPPPSADPTCVRDAAPGVSDPTIPCLYWLFPAGRQDFTLEVQHVSAANRDSRCADDMDPAPVCEPMLQPGGDTVWQSAVSASVVRSDGTFVRFSPADAWSSRNFTVGGHPVVRVPDGYVATEVAVVVSPRIVPAEPCDSCPSTSVAPTTPPVSSSAPPSGAAPTSGTATPTGSASDPSSSPTGGSTTHYDPPAIVSPTSESLTPPATSPGSTGSAAPTIP